jgi:hypothetical protein
VTGRSSLVAMAVFALGVGSSTTAAAQAGSREGVDALPAGTHEAAGQVLAARAYLARGGDEVHALAKALERTRELLTELAFAEDDAAVAQRAALDRHTGELQRRLAAVMGRGDLQARRAADLGQVQAKCQDLLARVADVLAEKDRPTQRQKARDALAALRAAGLRGKRYGPVRPTLQSFESIR